MNAARAQHIVIYWGRRGGGLDLFNLFVEECKERNIPIIASARPIASRRDGQLAAISITNVKAWFRAKKTLLWQASEGGIKSVVFIMSSPWDLFLGKRLEKSGVEVVRIIHDANPHPGERFPPNFWINLLTKDCSRIVTLSNYVASQLTVIYGVDPTKIMVCSFPSPKIENHLDKMVSSQKKILLIGRGKTYQGQKLLEKAWDLMDKTDKVLVIAGEGFKPNPKHSDIEYKNWWMTREEMLEEIATCDLVVFPYIEASQSGTIPICKALGVPVLVSNLGGLSEQIVVGQDGVVIENLTPQGLADSIKYALSTKFISAQLLESEESMNLVSGCLKLR
jgi:glycosyltransferase involved in cell wall biosynthesis